MKGIFLTIIIGLLVLAMIGMGMTDVFTAPTRNAAAVVGKEKIDLYDFKNAFDKALRAENLKRPKRITTEQAYQSGMNRTVVNELITNKLIELDADDLGVDVNRRDALEIIEEVGGYNNELTGKFDENKLMEALRLRRDNMTRKGFEEFVRNSLRQDQSLGNMTVGLVVPQLFVETQYKFSKEQRNVKFLVMSGEAVETPADPGDEVLQSFVEENAARYTAPEYRRFTILRLETADLMRDIDISDEDLQKRFDYKIKVGQLGTAETRSMTAFLSTDKEAAEAVTAALKSGKTVEAVTASLGLDSPEVYTNISATGTTDPNVGEIGYTLNTGDSATVEGTLGNWYSVKVTGITPAIIPDIESERATITAELKTEQGQRMVYEAYDLVQKELEEGMSLEEVGKLHGVPVASYGYISRTGFTPEGLQYSSTTEHTSLIEDEKILTEIFTSDIDFEGDAFVTSNDGTTAIRVDGIIDSARKPYDDIRAQALLHWQILETDKALETLMGKVETRALAGESLADIAATFEKGVFVTDVVMSRELKTPSLSQILAVRIFEASDGQIVRGPAADGAARIVAKIGTITPHEGAVLESVEGLQSVVTNSIATDIRTAYLGDVLKNNPVTYVDDNMMTILGISKPGQNAP